VIEATYACRVRAWQVVNASKKGVGSAAATTDYFGTAMVDDSKLTDAQKLMRFFAGQCAEKQYYKIKEQLYEQVIWEGYETHAYKPTKKADEFLMQVTTGQAEGKAQWFWRTSKSGNAEFVVKDFGKNVEAGCPILIRDRNCWSFANGFWEARGDKFYPYKDGGLPDRRSIKMIERPLLDTEAIGPDYTIRSGVYYGMDGKEFYDSNTGKGIKPTAKSWYEISTPKIDKIMSDQGWSRSVKLWMYVLLGRLSCEVGKAYGGDNWQMCPLLYGKAGTGWYTNFFHLFYFCDCFFIFLSGQ
jgi:hypothetical protein